MIRIVASVVGTIVLLWLLTYVRVPQTYVKEDLHMEQNGVYHFAMITDLDTNSRHPQKFEWKSYLQHAKLHERPTGYSVELLESQKLVSQVSRKNRSMELSDLVYWTPKKHPLLLAMCDYTGIVYKISPDGKVFMRFTVADGDGNEPLPFKTEWATVKDGRLYLGSIGKEYVNNEGVIRDFNLEWVKSIDSCGTIDNENWKERYNYLREVTNTTYPGYLIHEAVAWSPILRKWFFLPRRASSLAYHDGTNLLLIASEDFQHIDVVRAGPLEPEWGFTSVKFIPNTTNLIATKVKEVDGVTETKITIFDKEGNILLDPPFMHISSMKFEGLSFMAVPSHHLYYENEL